MRDLSTAEKLMGVKTESELIIYNCNKYPEVNFRMKEVKNNKGNTIKRNVDGRESPVHSITVENLNKEPHEPDEVTFNVFKYGQRQYQVTFSCPIMGLTEWMKPFNSKKAAIDFAENMAEAT